MIKSVRPPFWSAVDRVIGEYRLTVSSSDPPGFLEGDQVRDGNFLNPILFPVPVLHMFRYLKFRECFQYFLIGVFLGDSPIWKEIFRLCPAEFPF